MARISDVDIERRPVYEGLAVSPKTNLWHCLGKCNVGGSTIDWVVRTEGVSFWHAVELQRAEHPSSAAGESRVVKKGTMAKLEAPVAAEQNEEEEQEP